MHDPAVTVGKEGVDVREGAAETRDILLRFGLPLAAGLVLRVAALALYVRGNPFASHPFSDAHHYLSWARLVASGNAPGDPFYQAPLYPYFLSAIVRLFPGGLAPVYAVQLVLGLASIALLALLARRLLPAWAAAAAVTAYAVHPYPVYFEEKLLPEPLSVPLALLALWFALRAARPGRGRAAAAAAAAAAASLARATALLFGAIVFVDLLRRSRRGALVFLAAFLLVLSPVVVRHLRLGAGFVPVAANAGEVFYHGNNPNAGGSMGKAPGLGADVATLGEEARRVASARLGRPVNASGASAYWFGEGFRWIVRNPGAYVRLEARKVRLLLSARFTPLAEFFEFEASRFPGIPRALALVHYPVLLFALLALIRPEARRRIPPLVWAYAALQTLVPLFFFVSTRYVAPLLPALALLAGAGLAYGLRGRGRTAALALVPLIAALAYADSRMIRIHATPYAQLASIRSEEGRGDEALALYEEALRLAPLEVRHYQNLAKEREKAGDLEGAASVIGRAVRAGLADGQTLGYYGALLSAVGRVSEAEGPLREAIRLEPTLARAHYEIGLVYEKTGRLGEAEEAYRQSLRLRPGDPDARRALERIGGRAGGGPR
jgi:tetratricopeptide (TPR) repeat protein